MSASAPSVTPVTDQPQGAPSNKGLWIALAVVAVVVVGAVAFLFGASQSGSETPNTNTAAIPNVVGLSEAEATNALVAAGFQVTSVTSFESEEGEPGTVFQQEPQAGVEAEIGSDVRLNIVALSITVPDLKGLTETAATNLLLASGLKVGDTTKQESKEPAGTVLSQNPLPGDKLARDSEVNLIVSDGKQPVPDVIGSTQARAMAQVTAAGFRVEVVTVPTDDSNLEGIVIRMNPPAGRTVNVDSTIVLTVGDYRPAPSPTPEPEPTDAATQDPVAENGTAPGAE